MAAARAVGSANLLIPSGRAAPKVDLLITDLRGSWSLELIEFRFPMSCQSPGMAVYLPRD